MVMGLRYKWLKVCVHRSLIRLATVVALNLK